MRSNRRLLCGGAAVTALLLGGCSGSDTKDAAPVTTTTRAARAPACTAADLNKPAPSSPPAPHVVTKRFMLEKGTSWLDPPGAAKPAIGKDAAWQKLKTTSYGGRRVDLLLGYYTSIFDLKNGSPDNAHVLAWAAYSTHAALRTTGGSLVPESATTIPLPICGFGTAYTVINATTGKPIVIASY